MMNKRRPFLWWLLSHFHFTFVTVAVFQYICPPTLLVICCNNHYCIIVTWNTHRFYLMPKHKTTFPFLKILVSRVREIKCKTKKFTFAKNLIVCNLDPKTLYSNDGNAWKNTVDWNSVSNVEISGATRGESFDVKSRVWNIFIFGLPTFKLYGSRWAMIYTWEKRQGDQYYLGGGNFLMVLRKLQTVLNPWGSFYDQWGDTL